MGVYASGSEQKIFFLGVGSDCTQRASDLALLDVVVVSRGSSQNTEGSEGYNLPAFKSFE